MKILNWATTKDTFEHHLVVNLWLEFLVIGIRFFFRMFLSVNGLLLNMMLLFGHTATTCIYVWFWSMMVFFLHRKEYETHPLYVWIVTRLMYEM